MGDVVIRVNQLEKVYKIGGIQKGFSTLSETITESFVGPVRRARNLLRGEAYGAAELNETIFALKKLSFEIEAGEIVGIIGGNGAGKSTLLKILSRITEPTSGFVDIQGRVGTLLEVGTGMHPELTGRENAYLNGSILGMKRFEIDRKFDDIVAFSGVGKFIDTPVKHYSTGMHVRLAFSVAAHLDPEILMVDEVLAVGDAGFQRKCLGMLDNISGSGRTVLMVSHNMMAIKNLCSRVIWIENGEIRKDGKAQDVINEYLSTYTDTEACQVKVDFRNVKARSGSGEIQFTGFEWLTTKGDPKPLICSRDSLIVRLHYHAEQTILDPHFGLEIYGSSGVMVCSLNTFLAEYQIASILSGDGYIDVSIDSLNLTGGRYSVSIWVESLGLTRYDLLENCAYFDVESTDGRIAGLAYGRVNRVGLMFIPCQWKHESLQILHQK